jgi:hypothetical protein
MRKNYQFRLNIERVQGNKRMPKEFKNTFAYVAGIIVQ